MINLSAIFRKIKGKKSFIFFVILNFFDKGLTFLIPLVFLSWFNDPKTYNELEYIYSWATFLVIFGSLTLPNYLFYGYKLASDKEKFLSGYTNIFQLSNLLWIPCVFFVLLLCYFEIVEMQISVILFIMIRVLYINMTTYLTAYYRLKDKISNIFYYTSLCNAIVLIVLCILHYYQQVSLIYIFIIQLLFLIYFLKSMKVFDFKGLFDLAKKSFLFSWPTVIYLFLFMGVNNFAKIYAYGNLSEEEMTILSFVQRFALIIQLVHASIAAYISKRLFMEKIFFNFKIFLYYLAALTFVLILAYFGIILCIPYFISTVFSDLNWVVFLLLLYTYFWCIAAYSDLYFNKVGKPIFILLNSIPAILFYFIWVYIIDKTLYSLSLGMFIYAFILLIVCYSTLGINKKKFIKLL